jgi:AraC-like DNA-binding protein
MPKKEFKPEVVAVVVQIKKYIDDHPGTGISTVKLARDNDISRNALHTIFKYKFHKPIGRYKLQKRMQEGRRLLKSGWSIKEVSFKLNYASPSSFCDAFRNFYKLNPSDWLQKQKYNANKQRKTSTGKR